MGLIHPATVYFIRNVLKTDTLYAWVGFSSFQVKTQIKICQNVNNGYIGVIRIFLMLCSSL